MEPCGNTPASPTSGLPGIPSKTLVAGDPMRQPSWMVWTLMKGFRLLLLTALWSGLGMGAGLFGGIVVLMAAAVIHNRMPRMDIAYRNISIPVAIVAGSCAFLWNLVRTVQAAAQRRKRL
jgi:hypothetical protein